MIIKLQLCVCSTPFSSCHSHLPPQDRWTENLFHHNTFLASLSAILSQPKLVMYGPSLVIEPFVCGLHAVGVPWPNHFPLRPRQVEGHRSSPGMSASSSKHSVLLDLAPQKLITVYEGPNVLVFVPTPSSSSSGGFFQLFSATNDHLRLLPRSVGLWGPGCSWNP